MLKTTFAPLAVMKKRARARYDNSLGKVSQRHGIRSKTKKRRQYDHCLTRYRRGMKDKMKTASTKPHLAMSMAVSRLLRRADRLSCRGV